jgi:hypothetical protein
MKIFTLISLLIITTFGYAQNIPNGDFENWTTNEEYNLQGFTTVGILSRSSDRKVGKHALKLENGKKSGGNLFSAITNSEFGNGFAYGGVPYEDRPLSLKFWAKYDLITNDKAHIVCYFKNQTKVIGVVNFQIGGSSAGKFLEYSVPITWYSTGLPDSLAFFASSTSLYNNYTRGDGFIILDDMHFATINTRNTGPTNGDFENWDTTEYLTANSWFRTEDLLIAEEGDDFGYTWVTKVDNGQSGSAIRLQNQKIEDNIVAGALVSHNDFKNIVKPSFKVDKQWKYLEGYYKYKPVNGDSAIITIPMYNAGTLIGGAEYKFGKSTTEWTYFAIPLEYFGQEVDSGTLLIGSADFDNPLGDSSEFQLDQLRLADWTIGVQKPKLEQLLVYPNPASDNIQISFDNPGDTQIDLRDMHGRLIYSTLSHKSENRINTAFLESGLYQLSIENNQYRTVIKILKHE